MNKHIVALLGALLISVCIAMPAGAQEDETCQHDLALESGHEAIELEGKGSAVLGFEMCWDIYHGVLWSDRKDEDDKRFYRYLSFGHLSVATEYSPASADRMFQNGFREHDEDGTYYRIAPFVASEGLNHFYVTASKDTEWFLRLVRVNKSVQPNSP